MVHLMFGLEGSGFIISISLTFLLVGLVVYLMKRQMRGLEQKFCSIFELSQNLATSIEHIKSTQKDRRKEVHIENYSESENDTDDDTDDDAECSEGVCPINRMFESIKVIDINDNCEKPFNFENNALENMLNPSTKLFDKQHDVKNKENRDDNSDEEDSDEDNSDEENSDEDNSDEENSDEDNSDEENSDEDNLHEENLDEKNNSHKVDIVNKLDTSEQKINTNNSVRETISIDYHKLKVPDLRDLIVKQNILSEREVKTVKKQELINLLKKNN